MKQIITAFFLFVFAYADAQYPNIKIYENRAIPMGVCEPSIVVNPANEKNIVAGGILDYVFISNDAGHTWKTDKLKSESGVFGDPCLVADNKNHVYYLHLSDPENKGWSSKKLLDRIVVQRSDDGGNKWAGDSYTGLNPDPEKDQDKQWACTNFNNQDIAVTWTQFDKYNSKDTSHKSNILFSLSADLGETFSDPVRINEISGGCLDDDQTTEGAVPAFGPNGEIYVAWAGPYGIMFDKSLDGGETWGKDIFVADQIGGWDYDVSGVSRANGLPVTVCDTGNSPYRGNIYIMWTDQRNGATNPDVFIIKSTDGGETWGDIIRVNNDNTQRPQFFAAMAIDQSNGNIYVSFYDRRNTTGNDTEYYIARSTDGGETFENFRVTDAPFPMFSQVFFGDYTDVAAFNGKIYPIWMETDSQGRLSVWTSAISEEDFVGVSDDGIALTPTDYKLMQNYPNPFGAAAPGGKSSTTIEYSLPQSSSVTLKVYDVLGREVATLVNNRQSAGVHDVRFLIAQLNLSSGVYLYRLQAGSYSATKKMTIIR